MIHHEARSCGTQRNQHAAENENSELYALIFRTSCHLLQSFTPPSTELHATFYRASAFHVATFQLQVAISDRKNGHFQPQNNHSETKFDYKPMSTTTQPGRTKPKKRRPECYRSPLSISYWAEPNAAATTCDNLPRQRA